MVKVFLMKEWDKNTFCSFNVVSCDLEDTFVFNVFLKRPVANTAYSTSFFCFVIQTSIKLTWMIFEVLTVASVQMPSPGISYQTRLHDIPEDSCQKLTFSFFSLCYLLFGEQDSVTHIFSTCSAIRRSLNNLFIISPVT
jgi:hypothetical protein